MIELLSDKKGKLVGDYVEGDKMLLVDFLSKLKVSQYEENLSCTIGILVADYKQQHAREFIFNYLDIFHEESGSYIDFYIPGYVKVTDDTPCDFSVGGIKYIFDRVSFNTSILELKNIYGIKYEYRPLLILQEVINGNMTERIIVIDFDTEKAGHLFEEIFHIARREVNIEAFSKGLRKAQIKKMLPQIIKKAIKILSSNAIIEVVVDNADSFTKYRIQDCNR